MALFSAARSTRAPIPEVDRRTSRGGVAQLGVSRRGCGFVVCASRSLRGAKRHRTAALFRVSVASHLPARVAIVGLICAMASAALPASDRRNSTSVISRLAPGGCWVVIAARTSALGPFLIAPLEPNFTPARRPMNNRTEQNGALENGEIGPNATYNHAACTPPPLTRRSTTTPLVHRR